jgi:hypothetical protein
MTSVAGAGQGLQLTTADVVWGILNYSRWPGPVRPLQLCSVADSTQTPALLTLPASAPAGRMLAVQQIPADAPPPTECDAIFLGGGPAAEAQLLGLIGRPVLSIGEGASFCSRGGMFCLVPRSGGGAPRIEVNLDTVARSGLRVHPQVLKLSRPRAEGGLP